MVRGSAIINHERRTSKFFKGRAIDNEARNKGEMVKTNFQKWGKWVCAYFVMPCFRYPESHNSWTRHAFQTKFRSGIYPTVLLAFSTEHFTNPEIFTERLSFLQDFFTR